MLMFGLILSIIALENVLAQSSTDMPPEMTTGLPCIPQETLMSTTYASTDMPSSSTMVTPMDSSLPPCPPPHSSLPPPSGASNPPPPPTGSSNPSPPPPTGSSNPPPSGASPPPPTGSSNPPPSGASNPPPSGASPPPPTGSSPPPPPPTGSSNRPPSDMSSPPPTGMTGMTSPPPITMVSTTPNYGRMIDPSIGLIFNRFYPNMDPFMIFYISQDPSMLIHFFDNITTTVWNQNCDAANNYMFYLNQCFIKTKNMTIVTYDRMSKLLGCKNDCDFASWFQANFTMNVTEFLKTAMPLMPKNASSQCAGIFAQYLNLPKNGTIPLSTINSILPPGSSLASVLNGPQMAQISASDSQSLIQSQGANLDLASAIGLGANIPKNVSLTNVLPAACCVPFDVIKNAGSATIASNLGNMNLNFMDNTRKAAVATTILASNSTTDIQALLNCGNRDMVSQVPLQTLITMNANSLPSSVWPTPLIQYQANQTLHSTPLSSLSSGQMATILSGIGPSFIQNVSDSAKKTVVFNMLSAESSAVNKIVLPQKKACMKNIFGSPPYDNSTVMGILNNLTNSQITSLAKLVVEADPSLLKIISQSPKFSLIVQQNAKLQESECCGFLKAARDYYASFAIAYLTGNSPSTINTTHLDGLGICFVGNIPANYISSINASDFVSRLSYFKTKVFQPDSTTANSITYLISQYMLGLTTQSSIDSLFNQLGSVAVFMSSANLNEVSTSNLASVATQVLPKISSDRNVNDMSVQQCRIMTGDDSSISSMANAVNAKIVSALTSSGGSSRRRRRSTSTYTCSVLTSMNGTLNQLTVPNIQSISNSDFYSCRTLLGQTSNDWYSDQLSALASLAKSYYGSMVNIPDSEISNLNAIMLGFSSTDLQSLPISSIGSVQKLGTLDGWSSSQLTALIGVIKTNVGTVSSLFGYLGNLACGLSSTDLSTVSSTTFSNSISSLSQITNYDCPSISNLYSTAKTIYPTLSSSTISQFGSLMAGVSSSDLSTITTDEMSSMTTEAFSLMPSTTANSLSSDQINALSSSQMSAMLNSESYDGYSSNLKTQLRSAASNGLVSAANVPLMNKLHLMIPLVVSIFGLIRI